MQSGHGLSSILEQIRSLLDAKLYQDVELLISLILPMVNQHSKTDNVVAANYYTVLVCYGDSLYEGQQYKRAEVTYREALRLRKNLNKAKVKSLISESLLSEVELKYKLYECYMKLGDARNAMAVLEGITVRQRTPKVLMSLAKLYQISNMEKQALACYKEILRKCPLSISAINGLLQLGCSRDEVITLISSGINCPSWLIEWINGHSSAASREHKKAIDIFSNLESNHLHNSVPVLGSIAIEYYRQDDYRNAKYTFERIMETDPYAVNGLGIYARLLAKDKDVKGLFRLSRRLLQITENSVDTWLAMAEYNSMKDNVQRAIYFAQKAHVIDSSNVQALVLKASLLLRMNKTADAISHYQEAIKLGPDQVDSYIGLVNCYLADNKIALASSIAAKAYTNVGRTPSTLLLCGTVYLQGSEESVDKAKASFQFALNLDPTCELAACSLAKIYAEKLKEYTKAMKILQQFLECTPSLDVHLLLGNYYNALHKKQRAIEEYRIALSMDGECSEAQAAIDRLENQGRDLDDSSIQYELNPIQPLHFDIEDTEDGDASTTGSIDEME